MFSLKNLFSRLGGGGTAAAEAPAEAVEYKGYRIRPAPFRDGSQFQTAGTIGKDTGEGLLRLALTFGNESCRPFCGPR